MSLPFGSLGALSLILLVVCIVHAVRTGRIFPWIFIILFLPAIGPLIYLVVEILPSLVSARQSRRVQSGLTRLADPDRELREAKREVEMVGSADAKKHLAEQYVERGQFEGAIELYRSALVGAHADDPALLHGLARAQLLAGDGAGAEATLDALQQVGQEFVSTDTEMFHARALELQGKDEAALAEYAGLVRYSAGQEARCRYALLLEKNGQAEKAREIFAEIVKLSEGAPRHYRQAQREWIETARRHLAS